MDAISISETIRLCNKPREQQNDDVLDQIEDAFRRLSAAHRELLSLFIDTWDIPNRIEVYDAISTRHGLRP